MEFNVTKSSNPGLTSVISHIRNIDDTVYQRLEQINQNFMSRLGNVSRQFRDSLTNSFNVLTNRNMINRTLTNLAVTGSMYGDENVNAVTLNNYKRVGYTTRRYVMANPTINRYSRISRLSGYGDEWVDTTPDVAPEQRTDYKVVTDGLLVEDGNTIYFKSLSRSTKNPLRPNERMIVKSSWDVLLGMIANDEDPTEIE